MPNTRKRCPLDQDCWQENHAVRAAIDGSSVDLTERAAFPYVLYAVTYMVFGMLYAVATDHMHAPMTLDWLSYRAGSLVTAALSLLFALRFGRISYRGLLATTCVLFIAVELAIFALLELIAEQTPGHRVAVLDMVHLVHTWGWHLTVTFLASSLTDLVAVPLLALFFIRRLRPARVPV